MPQNNITTKNVCMIAYRPLPKFMNRIKIAQSVYENNFSVDFICPKEIGESSHDIIDDINVYRTEDDFGEWNGYLQLLGKYLLFCIRSFFLIQKLNKEKRYSYYHVHTPPDFLIVAILPFKLIYGSKIILDLHDMLPESVGSNLRGKIGKVVFILATFIEKISISFSDAVICTNEYDKEIVFSRNRIQEDQIYTVMNVPNPDDYTIKTDSKERFGLQDKFVVLFEGTIWKRRGIQTVIEAVSIIKDTIPVYFLIVGDGPDKEYLEEIVQTSNLEEHVGFTGWVDSSLLSRYISISDVCVIPFLKTKVNNRGVPNKLFEYTIHDKPIIASKLEGMSRVFSNDEILYFEPGDAENIASKILWTYENPDEANKYVQRAKKHYLQEYTWDKMEKELLRCYESLS